MKNPKTIVITGASSGLGAALALYYAAPGITLFLHGRNEARLSQVADMCREKEASVHSAVFDVTDRSAAEHWLQEADKQSPIDLVIANAGISAGTGGDEGETAAQTRAIFATNIDGVVNTVEPLIPLMHARRKGQIAIVSSLAGLRGLASSPAYSASKACVRVWAEGLRGWLCDYGIEVSAVCPGFIKTPMTDVNPYAMPLMMRPEKAASIIAAGLSKNKARIAFPWPLYWLTHIMAFLPVGLTDIWLRRLPAKPSF